MKRLTDDDLDELADSAIDWVVKLRDEDPWANLRWLRAHFGDWEALARLCIAVGTAVPDDRPWLHLTAWTRGGEVFAPPEGKAPLAPCGTNAAAARHRRRGEEVCPACRQAEREKNAAAYVRRTALRETAA